jgi:hypothetical protein
LVESLSSGNTFPENFKINKSNERKACNGTDKNHFIYACIAVCLLVLVSLGDTAFASKEFPPRQKPAKFNKDEVMNSLSEGGTAN